MLLPLLKQTFEKKARLKKVAQNHSKSRYYYFEDNQQIFQYQYEHEKEQNLILSYNR